MSTSDWSPWRVALAGALAGAVWSGWKVIESGIPWAGEGATYNSVRMLGAVAFAGSIGFAVAHVRNRRRRARLGWPK